MDMFLVVYQNWVFLSIEIVVKISKLLFQSIYRANIWPACQFNVSYKFFFSFSISIIRALNEHKEFSLLEMNYVLKELVWNIKFLSKTTKEGLVFKNHAWRASFWQTGAEGELKIIKTNDCNTSNFKLTLTRWPLCFGEKLRLIWGYFEGSERLFEVLSRLLILKKLTFFILEDIFLHTIW